MIRVHRDLRIVIMSANVDTTSFQEFFEQCAVIEVEGRTHSVQRKCFFRGINLAG